MPGKDYRVFPWKHLPGRHDQNMHGRMRAVDSAELIRKIKEDGGFTFQPASKDVPKIGYVVSTFPQFEAALPPESITAKVISRFKQAHADALKNPENYMGGWYDAEAGVVYLDVVRVTKDASVAHALAKQHSQEGYYDIEKGQTVIVKSEKERRLGSKAYLSFCLF